MRSNRGPNRRGKGIHTFAPVKKGSKSFLVSSPRGPLHCLGLGAGHYLDHRNGSWERQSWWLEL